MPGRMAYLGYTANDGIVYSFKTRARYLTALDHTAGVAALGFLAFDASRPIMPPGMKPRGVYVQDATGGATRFIPVGAVDAPVWTTPPTATTVQIDYSGIATLTDANVIGGREEKRRRTPHAITGLSDAS